MIRRSTAILCMVAILGVVAAVAVERAGGGAAGARAGAARRLLEPGALPVEKIDRITLERAGEAAMAFRRDEDGWRQIEPIRYPMDGYSMRELAVLAADLETVDLPEAAAEIPRRELGLDPPRAVLTFQWPGGRLRLRLGRRGVGGRAYLLREGDEQVHVVDQALNARASEMDAREWRDRTLFRHVGIDADRIEIASGGGISVALARKGKRWHLEAPVHARVDAAAFDGLLQALGRARCAGFVLDEPSDLGGFGLETPAGTVAVTSSRPVERDGVVTREPRTQRLLLGARLGVGSQDRFGLIEGRNVVLQIAEPVISALFPAPARLASRLASGVNPADVKSIRITTAAGTVEVSRDLERWVAPGRDHREVSAVAVDALLAALTRTAAEDVALGPYPRDRELATVTLYGFDARPLDTVRVARAPDGGVSLENGDGVLRHFGPGALALPLRPEDFDLAGP